MPTTCPPTRSPGRPGCRGGQINSPIRISSYIYVSVANGIVRLRADNGRPFGSYRICSGRAAAGYRSTRIACHPRTKTLVHAGGGLLRAVHLPTRACWLLATGGYTFPVVGSDGRLFAIRGTLDIEELSVAVPKT